MIAASGWADTGGRESVAGFLKGQTHAHSNHSGDSATPPEEVLRWYGSRGFDFVVLTDHNFVTVVPDRKDRPLAIPGVELTQNLETCTPPPAAGHHCLIHVNALFLPDSAGGPVQVPQKSLARRDLFGQAVTLALGLGGLAQINHPNFHYAADAKLLAETVQQGARFLEIANQSFDANNRGDAGHRDTEALWDDLLSSGATVWAVASDDAHHYYDAQATRDRGEPAFSGERGFVMVHARRKPSAIREAMLRGDFYASTGVVLSRAERRSDGGLDVAVAPASRGPHHIQCIGPGGRVLVEFSSRAANCPVAKPGEYVRAVVSDRQGRKAWLQPSRRP